MRDLQVKEANRIRISFRVRIRTDLTILWLWKAGQATSKTLALTLQNQPLFRALRSEGTELPPLDLGLSDSQPLDLSQTQE